MVHSTDKVVVVDGVALVFSRMTGATSAGGVRRKVNNVYLVVWGQENGAWKFIAHQPTPLPANEP
jgi:ketosteroid isomerase-like protein